MNNEEVMECSQEDLEKYLDGIPYYVCIKDNDDRILYANELLENRLGKKSDELMGTKLSEAISSDSICVSRNVGYKDNILLTEEYVNLDNNIYWYEDGIIEFNHEEKEKSIFQGILFRNITIQKKISAILEKHLNELISSKFNLADRDNRESQIFYEIIKNLKEELKSEDVFFITYGYEGNSFRHFYDNKSEDALTHILKANLKRPEEITEDNVRRLCEKECFGEEYKAIVNIREIVPGVIGIMIYKDAVTKKYNAYDHNRKQRFINTSSSIIKLISRINYLYSKLGMELRKRIDTERELQQFIETAIDLCCIGKIDEHGKAEIVNVTDSWRSLFGTFIEEKGIDRYTDFIHKDDLKKYKEEVIYKIHNKIEVGIIHNIDIRVIDAQGKYRYIEWKWKYMNDGVFVISGNDKTREKMYENEKIRLEKNVNRERINERFFTNLSLQFKNPINIIVSAIQLLELYNRKESRNSVSEKSELYIRMIEKNSYKLLKWSNDLIDISKIESMYNEFVIENVNIVEEIESIIEHTNVYFDGIRNNIIFDTDSEEIYTGCDLKKTEKTIFIIIDEFMRCSHRDAHIKVNVSHCGSEYVDIIFASDRYLVHGKRLREAIEFFYNDTDKYMKDTGAESSIRLRMSLLKEITKLFNGKLNIENEDEKIKVTLRLPIINFDDNKGELFTHKTLSSFKEKCNIEFSDIG